MNYLNALVQFSIGYNLLVDIRYLIMCACLFLHLDYFIYIKLIFKNNV